MVPSILDGPAVWVAVGCSAYWFPKKNDVGGLALKEFLVGKKRSFSGLLLFGLALRRIFFG